jgi:gliding motility-associated-like protein
MNKSDSFEEQVKRAVENYETPFNDDAWKKIENQIPGNSGMGISSIRYWAFAAATVAVVATGVWYFSGSDTDQTIQSIKPPTTDKFEEPVASDKNEITIDLSDDNDEIITIPINEKEDEVEEKAQKKDDELSEISDNADKSEIEVVVNDNNEEKTETIDRLEKKSVSENPVEEMNEELTVNWIISKSELCQGEELMVSINNVNEPVELTWDFGDGQTSKESKVYHRYVNPGFYTIKLRANSLISDGKVYREKKYIEVKANPLPNFSVEKNENMALLPEVNFSNLTLYPDHIEWLIENKVIENETNVKKLFPNKGIYQIGIIVSNQYGCTDSIFKDLIIEEDYNLMAPKAFTPNEDGMNDYFLPEALRFLDKKFTLQIISNKGKVVFQTKNVETPWNGKFNNRGYLLENGPYAWTVKFEDGSVYSGTVMLMTE